MRKNKRKKRNAKNSNLFDESLYSDFLIKQLDAKSRLAKQFICFIKFSNGGLFITGGEIEGRIYSNNIFSAAYIGGSRVELVIMGNLISSLSTRIASVYSENDFHMSMLRDFLSQHLKEIMEDMEKPRALAGEIIAVDVENNILNMNCSGDFEENNIDSGTVRVFLGGCYNQTMKEKIYKLLTKLLKKDDGLVSKEKATSFSTTLKNTLKIKNVSMYWYSLGEMQFTSKQLG